MRDASESYGKLLVSGNGESGNRHMITDES